MQIKDKNKNKLPVIILLNRKPYNSSLLQEFFIIAEWREQALHAAIKNVELMLKCCPKDFFMGMAGMK